MILNGIEIGALDICCVIILIIIGLIILILIGIIYRLFSKKRETTIIQQYPYPQYSEHPTQLKYCSHCKTQVPIYGRLCPFCGKKIK